MTANQPPSEPDQPIWHILGAGAIGRLLASQWQAAGLNIELLLRPSAVPTNPGTQGRIRFTRYADQSSQRFELPYTTTNHNSTIRRLVITTKANQVIAALAGVHARVSDTAKILLLHNGMGTYEPVKRQFPQAEVICGVTTEGAYVKSEHELVYAGAGTTQIGSLNSRHPPHWVSALLTNQLAVQWLPNIETVMHRKLLMNCAINALTALHNCRNGELLNIPKAKRHLEALCDELGLVAERCGWAEAGEGLSARVVDVLQATKANYSSTRQDVAHKRATEIEYINGYLCNQAQLNGVNTPLNLSLVLAIQRLERSYIHR